MVLERNIFSVNRPLVSIIVSNFNGKKWLKNCLESLVAQNFPEPFEIILVDDASTDGSVEYVKDIFPQVRLVTLNRERGFGGSNNVGIKYAQGKYVIFVNPDTKTNEHWLSSLVQAIQSRDHIGMVTSRVQLYDSPKTINACGNIAHYTGLGFCRGLGEHAETWRNSHTVPAVSGCSFIARKSFMKELGAFDEDFFLYLEDTDLSWRARLAGKEIWFEPSSVVFHRYDLTMNEKKFFHIEKNRVLMLLKSLRVGTLVLMLPALLLTEILVLGYACFKGFRYLRSKVMSYAYVLSHLRQILRKRRIVQRIRRVSDRRLVSSLDWRIPFEQAISNRHVVLALERTVNVLYRWLHMLVQKTH